MTDDVQLISDGSGLAVIGDPAAVELFLSSEGLESRELDLTRVRSSMSHAGSSLQAGAEVARNAGRWVKLDARPAAAIKKHGLMKGSTTGVSRAVVQSKGKGKGGGIKGIVEFASAPGGLLATLTNPAALTSIGALMAQVAMQQQMEEITDYHAVIDEKLEEIARRQKDEVLSALDGVALLLEDAHAVRGEVGRVSEITWSKIQASDATIAAVQARTLRELDAIAVKVERASQLGDRVKAIAVAETKTPQWLAVLARTFQLQDAVWVIELDRVLDAAPDDLEEHRRGLSIARQRRIDAISASTSGLIERMAAAAADANDRALAHPHRARAVVASCNRVVGDVAQLHSRLGLTQEHDALRPTRWVEALTATGQRAVATGAQGFDAARRASTGAVERATAAFQSEGTAPDGTPERPRARAAAERAGSAVAGATSEAAGKVGDLLRRAKRNEKAP